MKKLSASEEQVLLALWDCRGPATRHQIQLKLPNSCKWADSTVLNFLYRLEEKGFVTVQKQANRNLYAPTMSRASYLRQAAGDTLDTLYGGSLPRFLEALVNSGRIGLEQLEATRSWLDEQIFELGDFDRW